MADQMLITKFFIPPARPESVPRPNLIRQLDEGLNRKLTLISAPAGFGKTTLLTEWLEHLQGIPNKWNPDNDRIAWLSLDEGDNDLMQFLTYIFTAINQREDKDADICTEALEMIQSLVPPATEIVLTSFINGIATFPGKLLLILDDYHLIETQAIHESLDFILSNLPPQMHLVIGTREDPLLQLSRLRARAQIIELRAADLRFTHSEASEFLNCVMGLKLSENDIDALESRTEGWITGLQLAALSIQEMQSPETFIRSFTGSHRLVLEYLIEEVLEQQTGNIRTFLLQTSILDRMCGSLCDSLNNQVDGQATLEMLERANLFIVPLDNERHWYRYHHLFADLLRQRLSQDFPELIPTLYSKASEWLETNGFIEKAIEYSLQAKDFTEAANLLETAWLSMSARFQFSIWLGWAGKLPDDLVRTRPFLSTQYAEALLEIGELEDSESRFQDAEDWLESKNNASNRMHFQAEDQFRELPAKIAFNRGRIALAQGDILDSVNNAELAINLSSDESEIHSQATVLLGLTYWAGGDLKAAYSSMADWIDNMRGNGNAYYAVAGSFGLADIRIAQGRLRDAEQIYKQVLQLASEQDASIQGITAHHHLGLAMIYHETGDQEAFTTQLDKSRKLGEQSTLVDWPYRWHIAQADIRMVEKEWSAAQFHLDEAGRLYVRNLVPDIQPVESRRARVYIRQGLLDEAGYWIDKQGVSFETNLSYLSEYDHITLARLCLARYRQDISEGDITQAFELLMRLLEAAESGYRTGSVIEILALLSLACEAQINISSAQIYLEKALKLAEPEGYVRIFVDEGPPMARLLYDAFSRGIAPDYVRKLLTNFPEINLKKKLAPGGIDAVSAREIEVLQLISEGLSNQDVADRLFISLHTVKGHTRNIYGKLGVKNRTQAIVRAKALGILLTDSNPLQ